MELISVGTTLRLLVIFSAFLLFGANSSRMWDSFEQRQLAAEKKNCFSPCKIFHSWCKNDGKCREKGPDCSWYCECPENCDGFFCEKIVDNKTGIETVRVKTHVIRETEKHAFSFDNSKLEQALANIHQKTKDSENESGKPTEPEQRVVNKMKVKENITITGTFDCPPDKVNRTKLSNITHTTTDNSTSADVSTNTSTSQLATKAPLVMDMDDGDKTSPKGSNPGSEAYTSRINHINSSIGEVMNQSNSSIDKVMNDTDIGSYNDTTFTETVLKQVNDSSRIKDSYSTEDVIAKESIAIKTENKIKTPTTVSILDTTINEKTPPTDMKPPIDELKTTSKKLSYSDKTTPMSPIPFDQPSKTATVSTTTAAVTPIVTGFSLSGSSISPSSLNAGTSIDTAEAVDIETKSISKTKSAKPTIETTTSHSTKTSTILRVLQNTDTSSQKPRTITTPQMEGKQAVNSNDANKTTLKPSTDANKTPVDSSVTATTKETKGNKTPIASGLDTQKPVTISTTTENYSTSTKPPASVSNKVTAGTQVTTVLPIATSINKTVITSTPKKPDGNEVAIQSTGEHKNASDIVSSVNNKQTVNFPETTSTIENNSTTASSSRTSKIASTAAATGGSTTPTPSATESAVTAKPTTTKTTDSSITNNPTRPSSTITVKLGKTKSATQNISESSSAHKSTKTNSPTTKRTTTVTSTTAKPKTSTQKDNPSTIKSGTTLEPSKTKTAVKSSTANLSSTGSATTVISTVDNIQSSSSTASPPTSGGTTIAEGTNTGIEPNNSADSPKTTKNMQQTTKATTTNVITSPSSRDSNSSVIEKLATPSTSSVIVNQSTKTTSSTMTNTPTAPASTVTYETTTTTTTITISRDKDVSTIPSPTTSVKTASLSSTKMKPTTIDPTSSTETISPKADMSEGPSQSATSSTTVSSIKPEPKRSNSLNHVIISDELETNALADSKTLDSPLVSSHNFLRPQIHETKKVVETIKQMELDVSKTHEKDHSINAYDIYFPEHVPPPENKDNMLQSSPLTTPGKQV